MDMVLTFVGWIFTGVGGIAAFVGGLWLLGVVFSTSFLWGVAYLVIPLASLVFIVTHWDDSKKPFLLQVAGVFVMILGIFMVGMSSPDAGLFGDVDDDSEWASYDDDYEEELYDWETDDESSSGAGLQTREEWTPPRPSNRVAERRRAPLPDSVDFDDASKLLGEKVRVIKVSGNRFDGRLDHVDDESIEVAMYSGAGRMNVTIPSYDIDRIELLTR